MQTNHLNDDQFSDYLIGEAPASEVAAHLAQCETCSAELQQFGMAVEGFNRTSMGWSQARPLRGLEAAEGSRRFRRPRPVFAAYSWALAACLLLVAGVFGVLHHVQSERPANIASVSAPAAVEAAQDSDAQIAQDNKMLMDVDLAIRREVRSPVQEYGLTVGSPAGRRARGGTKIQ